MTGNTAPKLLEQQARDLLDTALRTYGLHEDAYHVGCGGKLDMHDQAAIHAIIAALAPPSGDGDQFKLIQQALFALWQSPNDYAARATAQTWLRPEDLAAYRATPQSAPVDGELARIGELIRTQDNRITDQPMFIVQQKREYVAHPDYDHDRIAWFDGDGEASEEEAAALEAQYKDTHLEPAGWTRAAVGYYWDFVTACFTEQGCKDYISRNGHNLREPRIYAEGSYRNAEWRTVRNYLAGLTTPPPASQERGGEEYEFEVWQDDTMQAGGCTSTLETALAEGNHYAMMYGQDGDVEVRYYARTKLNPSATSLPSSAAEPDRFGVASPFDHTKHPVVRPDSHGVAGAAEQDSSAAEDHPGIMDGHGRLPWVAKIPAIPYPDAAEQAKHDDCPSCGQPQAGELPPRCAAARTLGNETLVEVALQAAGRASMIDSEIHRSRYSECRTELLRRLAGGVTVDDAMVERLAKYIYQQEARKCSTLDAYSHHMKGWPRALPEARAMLVAALGAK